VHINPSIKKWGTAYVAYIRVSTVKQGEHGVSLQEQKEAITRYAERTGLVIAVWLEETETAAKRGRPVFSQMLKQLRRGVFCGILIHKIDRGARNLRDWAEFGQLIDQGIEVHFCHESLDLNSRGGRLSADIQAVVAADFIRNLREETRKGVYGRLRQGLYPFRAPIGYLDCGGGKPKLPDPATAPLVQWTFEQYATGTTGFHALCDELAARGLRNRDRGNVSLNGLSTILNNPFYTGQIRIFKTGETFPGIHEPLVGVALFERVQSILKGKRQHCGLRHDFLFRRMLICRLCQKTLIGERVKGHVYYRCHTKGCPTTGLREEVVETAFTNRLSEIQLSNNETAELEALVAYLRDNWANEHKRQTDALALQLAQMQRRLDRLTDAFVDGLIDRETFIERKAGLIRERQVLLEKKTALSENMNSAVTRFEKFLERAKTAYLSYENGNPFQKREIVESVTSNRWVERKNVELELRNPFLALEKWRSFTLSDPRRGAPRTFFDDVPQKVPDVPHLPDRSRLGEFEPLINSITQLPPDEFQDSA
jgi:DNA invertase Pin-like site-specific DNA recombinase